MIFHRFNSDISGIEIPALFTFPFDYIPHELTVIAVQQVMEYLEDNQEWNDEIGKGKMFGVMVVKNSKGELGFLVAFSGMFCGKTCVDGFVPPVYDYVSCNDDFKMAEIEVAAITREIDNCRRSDIYLKLNKRLEDVEEEYKKWLEHSKIMLADKKKYRNHQREKGNLTLIEEENLIKESQYQKAEYNRTKKQMLTQIEECRNLLFTYLEDIEKLKVKRKNISSDIQCSLFKNYKMMNANGREKNIYDIFYDYNGQIPPSGTGDCAAPKLFQYAYLNDFTPISMAEFWKGKSPKGEIRHDGEYYPACMSKCFPILNYMLQGLEVERDPKEIVKNELPKLIYEDEYIVVVDKPHGMLSVPGKIKSLSVYDWAKLKYKDIEEPIIVHRLDMSTSGLLLLAKTKNSHKAFQDLFQNRKIHKKYVALLKKIPLSKEGEISLPICVDINNRPCQMVNFKHGKPAITKYRVLDDSNPNRVLIQLQPITGRTHQLRVHCASSQGLNTPIIGDALYGKTGERLFLHAKELEFVHPFTNVRCTIVSEHNFCVVDE